MKALTVKNPWAWAIIYAGKDVENRPRRTPFRDTIAIHTSKQPKKGWEESYPKRAIKPPPPEEWMNGYIIGFVDLVGCVESSRSKWWDGESFAYVLKNPRALRRPVECKGALGLWEVPMEMLRKCRD